MTRLERFVVIDGNYGLYTGMDRRIQTYKRVSAEQALSAIKPGSRIFLGTGCAAPRKLLTTLGAMSPGPADLEFVSFVTTSALPEGGGASTTQYRYRTFFVGSDVRHLAGQLDYVPICLEEVPKVLAAGRLPIDVALLQVSPPDARGFVSLGVSVDLAPAVLAVPLVRMRSSTQSRGCSRRFASGC